MSAFAWPSARMSRIAIRAHLRPRLDHLPSGGSSRTCRRYLAGHGTPASAERNDEKPDNRHQDADHDKQHSVQAPMWKDHQDDADEEPDYLTVEGHHNGHGVADDQQPPRRAPPLLLTRCRRHGRHAEPTCVMLPRMAFPPELHGPG